MFDTMDVDKLTASIKQNEGLRLRPYADTTGKLTIGYGRNLTAKGISTNEADFLLCRDIESAIGEAEAQPWWTTISGNDARERALIEIVFNLGLAGVNSFHTAIGCLENADFNGASVAFLDSLWAKQVGRRAEVLASMIMNGTD